MKKYIAIALVAMATVTGCDRGFDELNTNKIDPTTLDPVFVLNRSVVDITFTSTANTQAMLCYNFPIVQQILTPFGSSLTGGNYNQLHRENATRLWNFYYPNIVKQIVDVVERTRDVPEQHNLHQFGRIWKAYVFMALTDTYGDIPYFEAGKGYSEGAMAPKYDAQEAIYADILNELDEASNALDASLAPLTSDILYGGNVAQWKRFGFSLMLRAAMRLTKVDPATAETYVQKAVAGGLMESNEDNAKNRHSSLYINWMGEQLSGREKANFYLAEPFVNHLQETDDPRLPVYAIRYVGAQNGTQQTASRATSDPDMQVGMPFGYNDVSIVETYAEKGVVSLWDYSQANQTMVVTQFAPEFFVTYAQTQLLLAEAIVRGWASGDAAETYERGVRANMEQMAEYGAGGIIEEAAIQTYLDAHPLDMANAIEQINTQYWVVSFLDGNELFANFRRSGYPELDPNPYPGSEISGDFIRRLVYPDSEYVVNNENVSEAIARQGADDLNTRVWWDKE